MHIGKRRIALAGALAVVVTLSACSSSDTTRRAEARPQPAKRAAESVPAPVQHLEIVGTEYHFEIEPDPAAGLREGWTEVHFTNAGSEAHQVMFARLKDGVDMTELAQAGAGDSSGASAIEFVDMIGGVSYIGPGQDITAMVNLPAGVVVAMCYVPDATGTAHALSGMSTILNVQETGNEAETSVASTPAEERVAVEGTITLTPDGYDIPDELPKGWYHVVNKDAGEDGAGLHELAVMRLDRELTRAERKQLLDDIATNAKPDVALEALGGLGAISPGFDGYLYLDLPRGNYLAVDFMPDAGKPRPHLLDGYATSFTR